MPVPAQEKTLPAAAAAPPGVPRLGPGRTGDTSAQSHQVCPGSLRCHLAGNPCPPRQGTAPPTLLSPLTALRAGRGHCGCTRALCPTAVSPVPSPQCHRALAEAPPAEERGCHGLEASLCLHPGRGLPELCARVAPGPHLPLHQVTAPIFPSWPLSPRWGWLWDGTAILPANPKSCWLLPRPVQALVGLCPGAVLPRAQPCHQPGLGAQRGAAAVGVTRGHGHAGEDPRGAPRGPRAGHRQGHLGLKCSLCVP